MTNPYFIRADPVWSRTLMIFQNTIMSNPDDPQGDRINPVTSKNNPMRARALRIARDTIITNTL